MFLTKLSISRPVAAVIIVIGIIVFGVMSILSLPMELTPEMELPMLIVTTVYPGAGPPDTEKLISREIEGAVGSLSGINTVSSISQENLSLLVLQYEYGTNMDVAYMDLKERLDNITEQLPDGARKPTIIEMNINSVANIYISASSNSRENLLYYVEEEIVPEFEKLASVADITVSGGREEYIKVELMEDKLQQYGVSMSTIAGCISSANFSIPSGTADYGSQALSVRSSVEYNTLDQIMNISIPAGRGDALRLADLCNVYINTKAADSASRYNGENNVSLAIQKRQSASSVGVSRDVLAVLESINEADPSIQLDLIYDSSDLIVESLSTVGSTLVLGIFLSMAVLFLFLGDLRASLIVGSSMPVSLLVTFIIMDMMGFTLNIVTMSGLVLGVGMMVDNSIVVLDSCFKSQTKDKTFKEAALEGTQFVLNSIVASTITTVVVFFPLATIQGISGQLFKPLGFTIIFSLSASLFSAISLVPLFFTRFQPRERRKAPVSRLLKKTERAYGRLLKRLLRKKKTVLAVSLALVAVSLLLATQINVELMPSLDEGAVDITVEGRPGVRVDRVDEQIALLETMVAAHPDVDRYSASASDGSGSIQAYLKEDRKMETAEIVEQWREEVGETVNFNVNISASGSMTTMMSSSDAQVLLKGNDLDAIRAASRQVLDVMNAHPDIISATTTVEDGNPQAEIVVDPLKAASVGLTPIQVATGVNAALGGTDTVKIRMDNQLYDVRVEYPEGRFQNVSDLSGINLTSPAGTSVPIMDVASIKFTDSPQSIRREDSEYIVTISGTPKDAARFTAPNEILESVQTLEFPEGVALADNTMQTMQNEEFGALGRAILTAILLVFMVMSIQFESMRFSFMVMICIPFSLIGSFSLLFLARSTISMVSILGFLVLVGTVVNNGILFVDTTNQYRASMDVETALVSAGRNRLRPILMTTLTTILSMIPLALGYGNGGKMMQGLGVVVVGGLLASTVLTLLLLPSFYLILDRRPKTIRKKEEKRRLKEEKREQKDEDYTTV